MLKANILKVIKIFCAIVILTLVLSVASLVLVFLYIMLLNLVNYLTDIQIIDINKYETIFIVVSVIVGTTIELGLLVSGGKLISHTFFKQKSKKITLCIILVTAVLYVLLIFGWLGSYVNKF